MSLMSCTLCHKDDLYVRWIGPLHATWCDFCGCIYVPRRDDLPEPASPASAPDALVPPLRASCGALTEAAVQPQRGHSRSTPPHAL